MIIITSLCNPNTAFANRLRCIAKGLMESGVDVIIYGLASTKEVSSRFCEEGIDFRLLYGGSNKYLGFFIGVFKGGAVVRKSPTSLLLIVQPILLFIILLFKGRGSYVYHERTEYPDLAGKDTFFSKIHLALYHRVCKKFNSIWVISTALRDYFIRNGVDKEKIIIFPMLVDPTRFENTQVTKPVPYIAYCGDMANDKDGLFDLIQAYSVFKQKIQGVLLYLIGDTKSNEQMGKIKKISEDLGIIEDVVFAGRVSVERIPALLGGATVLALARPDNRQAQGGFPTKLGEYLATGVPVVVTRTGDIDLYLEDNKNCFFVEPGCPQKFAEKLVYVFENPQVATLVGIEGKQKVYESFNYLVQVKKLIGKLKNENSLSW